MTFNPEKIISNESMVKTIVKGIDEKKVASGQQVTYQGLEASNDLSSYARQREEDAAYLLHA